MNLLTTALLLASAFEVLVPVGGYRTAPEKLRCEFDSVKKLDSERIVFVAGVMMRDAAKRAEIAERIRLNVRDAKKEGFRETAAWFWSFWCSDARCFTTLTASDGWESDHICCPLDPGFRQVAGDMVRDFARTGVDMLLLDDDYRYGIYHDEELVCTCARHMALVEKNLGERIAPAELKKKAMTGGRNRWRDAWMDANGEAFRDYAAFLRKCVDEVNPKIRLGLCACMSHWDNDGVDAATTARILAGGTRPFLRLIAAPYWASPDGPHYYGCNLQSVIEFSRMERTWVTGDDIEVVSEGDTYPRPRWTCGSSHLELFDLALRVDGRFDGILKYAVDYDDPTRDGGYVARHVRNRPLYKEVARRFDGKKAVGVRIYEEMNRLREAVLDGDLAGNTKIFGIFGSPAAKCCGDLAIPTVWEGEGLVGMAFGENVRHVPAEARRRGLVIDAWAARILMAQGVDVGVKDWGKKVQTGVDVVADGLVNSYAAYEGYDVTLAAGAEVIGPRTAGRPPYAFLYRNAAGEKYLVLPLEAYWTKSGWHRTYEAGRLLAEGIRRLAGRPLPAFLPGNPDVLLMAKDGADGSRSVAVFNCFSDALVDAPIELDRAFDRVEFVNCRGRLEGSRVILDEVPAYDFAALTVFPPAQPPADWVDPFVGTDTVGHTYPAACVPFGMVQAGPDTGTMEWKYCSGYQYADTNVLGFSQTHLNGTGCPDLGDVQVFPFSGALRPLPMQSGFRKANEKAKPGFYATYLDADAVGVEIAAEKRGALYRFRYDRGAAKILFNLSFAIAEPWTQAETSDAWIEARGPRRLVGSLTRKGWIPSRRVSFAVAFDRAWTKFERLAETEKGVPRYVLSFDDLKAGETVQMKIALSMTDVAAAERNLAAMCPGFDIAAVRAAAEADWNRVLARLTCEGSETEKRNFYTAAYHLFQQPNDYSDVGAPTNLTTLSIWDTFRAAQPLYTIVAPEIAEGTVRACLAHGRENGELPVMSYGGKALSCMIGNHAVPMIVDLFLKREADFPCAFWEEAYRQVKDTLTVPHAGKIKEGWEMYDRYGYYPCDLVYGESVSRTLECGYDDWCAAQMAKRLGHDADAAFFLKRAARWRNVFDPELKLMRGKDSRGRWREPFDPYAMGHGADTENDFTEGNAFQYTWHVLQDPQELIAAFGSPATFVERLDAIFADQARIAGEGLTVDISGMIGQYVHGNEPSHHVPYLYALAGRPDRTAEVVREVFDRFYFPKPDGLCGNDDCGQMSAWYLFSAMGFYPVNPCGGDYVIGAPQLPKVTLALSGGKTFTVVAEGLSRANKYVKSVRLNGRPLAGGVLRHADILAGGELRFEMTAVAHFPPELPLHN